MSIGEMRKALAALGVLLGYVVADETLSQYIAPQWIILIAAAAAFFGVFQTTNKPPTSNDATLQDAADLILEALKRIPAAQIGSINVEAPKPDSSPDLFPDVLPAPISRPVTSADLVQMYKDLARGHLGDDR